MNNKTAKTLTFTAYGALIAGIIAYISLASIPWGVFIAWPFIVLGFLAWAILLTVADRYKGSDKKAIYKRNQIIFLVLLGLIVIITLFSTILR